MKPIKSVALYIFLALLAYMPLHIFFSTWIGSSFDVLNFTKVFKDVVLVAGFLFALIASVREAWFKALLKDKLIWLIASYGILTLALAHFKTTEQDAEILGVVYNLRFLLFFLYGLLLVRLYPGSTLQAKAIKIVLAVAVPVLLFGLLQYYLLPSSALTHVGYSRANGVLPAFFIDDKPDLERVMSSLRDPNSLGSYLIIVGLITLVYWRVRKNKELRKILLGLGLLTVLCLWLTFSRSAWIGALLAAGTLVIVSLKNKGKLRVEKKWLIVAGGLAALTLLAVVAFRDSYFIKNVIFHADESTVLEDPNEKRARFWQESIDSAVKEPLGYGPGTAGIVSIRNEAQGTVLNENYYLQILYEVGFLGILLFMAILYVVLKHLYKFSYAQPLALALFAAGIGLLFTNLLVHIWANEAVAYTWWGLAGLVYFRPVNKERSLRKA